MKLTDERKKELNQYSRHLFAKTMSQITIYSLLGIPPNLKEIEISMIELYPEVKDLAPEEWGFILSITHGNVNQHVDVNSVISVFFHIVGGILGLDDNKPEQLYEEFLKLLKELEEENIIDFENDEELNEIMHNKLGDKYTKEEKCMMFCFTSVLNDYGSKQEG